MEALSWSEPESLEAALPSLIKTAVLARMEKSGDFMDSVKDYGGRALTGLQEAASSAGRYMQDVAGRAGRYMQENPHIGLPVAGAVGGGLLGLGMTGLQNEEERSPWQNMLSGALAGGLAGGGAGLLHASSQPTPQTDPNAAIDRARNIVGNRMREVQPVPGGGSIPDRLDAMLESPPEIDIPMPANESPEVARQVNRMAKQQINEQLPGFGSTFDRENILNAWGPSVAMEAGYQGLRGGARAAQRLTPISMDELMEGMRQAASDSPAWAQEIQAVMGDPKAMDGILHQARGGKPPYGSMFPPGAPGRWGEAGRKILDKANDVPRLGPFFSPREAFGLKPMARFGTTFFAPPLIEWLTRRQQMRHDLANQLNSGG